MLGVIVFAIGRGSETYIARHIDHLAPGCTAVCTFSTSSSDSWTSSAPVLELFNSSRRSFGIAQEVLRAMSPVGARKLSDARLGLWLIKNRIQVVFCEYLQVAAAVVDLCRRLKIPVVAHAHGYDITAQAREAGWADRYSQKLPLMDEIVVVSQDMREKVLRFGVAAEKVHVIPCGTAVSVDPGAGKQCHRTSFKLLAVGRLTAKKGPILLLEAFRQIRQVIPNVELSVIGDGEFREPMRQYLVATRLEGSAHLLGALSNEEVRKHLRDADLFLQHSITADNGDEEGLPVAILEAMAESVPVVATRHAGIPEVVADGQNGFLVTPGDTAGMAQRSIQLLEDSALRARFGGRALSSVQERFSIDREMVCLREILAKYWPQAALLGGVPTSTTPVN